MKVKFYYILCWEVLLAFDIDENRSMIDRFVTSWWFLNVVSIGHDTRNRIPRWYHKNKKTMVWKSEINILRLCWEELELIERRHRQHDSIAVSRRLYNSKNSQRKWWNNCTSQAGKEILIKLIKVILKLETPSSQPDEVRA